MDLDAFDLFCHLAFDRKALPRRERANHVLRPGSFEKYGKAARKVLDALVTKFSNCETPAPIYGQYRRGIIEGRKDHPCCILAAAWLIPAGRYHHIWQRCF